MNIAWSFLFASIRVWYIVKCWDSIVILAYSQERLLKLHFWKHHKQQRHIKNGIFWSSDKWLWQSCPSLHSVIIFYCTWMPVWPSSVKAFTGKFDFLVICMSLFQLWSKLWYSIHLKTKFQLCLWNTTQGSIHIP